MQLSPMLGDIVKRLLGPRADVAVVGELESPDRLLAQMRRKRPGLVIFGLTTLAVPSVLREALERHPLTRVLAVEDDGRQSFMYELRPHKVPLGELSPARLVEVIGAQAGESPWTGWSPT